jgi:hypothetical protein
MYFYVVRLRVIFLKHVGVNSASMCMCKIAYIIFFELGLNINDFILQKTTRLLSFGFCTCYGYNPKRDLENTRRFK